MSSRELKEIIKCPVCRSNISHRRIDDGITEHDLFIDKDGKPNICESGSDSNGYDEFECPTSPSHKLNLSNDEHIKLLDFVYENT